MNFALRSLLTTLVLLTSLSFVASRANGQLISLSTRKSHAFDPVNRILYITTSAGRVERYNVDTSSFLSPWTLGGTLGGIDVTPNGATVLVADSTYNVTTDLGNVQRVDAATGTATTLTFLIDGGQSSSTETGAWDVVALSDTHAFFTTDFVGSAWVPFHEWNLQTNAITNRATSVFSGFNEVRERTWLFRSEDRNSMLGLESEISSGPIFKYDATSDTFPAKASMNIFHADGMGAVSRDGQWVAVESDTSSTDETWIYPKNLSSPPIKLSPIIGGLFFSPTADVLYGIDINADDVVAFDTNTSTQISRTHVATNLIATSAFNSGVTSFDPETNTLFLSVIGGIYKVTLPAPPTPPNPLDYNRDGFVDEGDYAAWQAHFGAVTGIGDGDRDGRVTATDYVLWRSQLSAGLGSGTANIPEPSLFAYLTVLSLATIRRSR